jgi:hypothetical protein
MTFLSLCRHLPTPDVPNDILQDLTSRLRSHPNQPRNATRNGTTMFSNNCPHSMFRFFFLRQPCSKDQGFEARYSSPVYSQLGPPTSWLPLWVQKGVALEIKTHFCMIYGLSSGFPVFAEASSQSRCEEIHAFELLSMSIFIPKSQVPR